MIAASLLFVCALANVRLETDVHEVRIGEPVTITLTVEHAANARVALPDGWPALDTSWALVDTGLVRRSLATDGSATTRASWRVLSLEPGDRTLPPITIDVGGESVTAQASALTVKAELAANEDEPRPMRGFLPPPERTGGHGAWWILGGFAALVAFAIWRWRARARRKPVAMSAPTPLEQLAALREKARAEPEAARRVTYAAAALLRGAVDAHLRETRTALPDEDWVRRIESDERVPLGVRSGAARILHDAEKVKYALVSPTPFALEEMLSGTESALTALASAPAVAVPTEVAA